MAEQIRVSGLKELRRELKAVDAQFPKELRKVNLAIAEEVAAGTRAAFGSQGGSAPKVVPTVKALGEQVRARVKVGGGAGVAGDVAMGNLFGSSRYAQFPSPGQYALFPTIAAMRGDIETRYLQMLDDLLKRAFPD